MTIQEAVSAARACVPVVYHDAMLGDMVFGRICEIIKTYRTPERVARGYEQEVYYLTLESMRAPGQSLHTCPPEDVRIATAEDIVRSGIPDELTRRREIEERIAERLEAVRAESGDDGGGEI